MVDFANSGIFKYLNCFLCKAKNVHAISLKSLFLFNIYTRNHTKVEKCWSFLNWIVWANNREGLITLSLYVLPLLYQLSFTKVLYFHVKNGINLSQFFEENSSLFQPQTHLFMTGLWVKCSKRGAGRETP